MFFSVEKSQNHKVHDLISRSMRNHFKDAISKEFLNKDQLMNRSFQNIFLGCSYHGDAHGNARSSDNIVTVLKHSYIILLVVTQNFCGGIGLQCASIEMIGVWFQD